MTAQQPTLTSSSAGGRIVAADGRELPMKSVHLSAHAGGGIARVALTQRFVNPFAEPLEVRYLLPLPGDGAVSGFSFVLGDVRVKGQVEGKQVARARYQQALAQGRTAALLEQERSALFSQRVGNVPPGCELVAEVTVDQPLRWLDEGAWEWRFPTVVGARYLGAPGRVADAAALDVPVADGPLGVRASLALTIEDGLTGPIESPSHEVEARVHAVTDVRFDRDGAVRLDRDVVVRWPVALPSVSARVIAARPGTPAHDGDAFALVTVAPPTGGWTAVPRDLTFLIDASGSMSGRPLEQCKRVVAAMIDTLGVNDRIELIEFASRPRRWEDAPQLATEGNKAAALAWLSRVTAGGGTEMSRAVLEALRPLRPDSQRQVVLLTDGYIGFEQEIVRTLLTGLPAGARLHTVGVGSSVNRSLTRAAARAGRGTELIIGIDEDAERAVARLVARTTAPLVTDLTVEGAGVVEVAPRQLPDLYAEAPALIAVRLRAGGGEVVLRGRGADGAFEQRLRVPALERGQGAAAVAALYAREKVEDLETAITAGGDRRELDRAIEATGIEFQISTRLTSWVAVSERVTVVPQALRHVEQPHELPHGVPAEGLGLRPAQGVPTAATTTDAKLSLGRSGRRSLDAARRGAGLGEPPEELTTELRGVAPGPPPAAAPSGLRSASQEPPARDEQKKDEAPEAPREKGEADGGRRLGDFLLERSLGQGGMGEVWLARKVPPADEPAPPPASGAFRRPSARGGEGGEGEDGETEAYELMDESGESDALRAGTGKARPTEPTIILTDSDSASGMVESADELTTSDAGARAEVSFAANAQDAESTIDRITTKRSLPGTRTGARGFAPEGYRSRAATSPRRLLLIALLLLALALLGLWAAGAFGGGAAVAPPQDGGSRGAPPGGEGGPR